MNLSDKIRELRKKKKLTQEELASVIGVERSTIGKYETGVRPSTEILSILADYFGVTVDYLIGRSTLETAEHSLVYDNIFPITKKRLPLLGEIACGQPIYAEEQRESYIMTGTDVDADFCLKAKGDSMIGARIMDGDIVFIKKMPIVANGTVAAVIIEDEATLKRVYYYPEKHKLILTPENPKYEPIVFIGEELNSVRILGQAVAFQSDVI